MRDFEQDDLDNMQEPVLYEALAHCRDARDDELGNFRNHAPEEVSRKERMVAKSVDALNELLRVAGSAVAYKPTDST